MQRFQTELTLSPEIRHNTYHVAVLTQLTRNLARSLPDLRDPRTIVLTSILSSFFAEWKLVAVRSTSLDIVARVVNRLFVGLPLCALADSIPQVGIKNTSTLTSSTGILSLFPSILKPLIARFFSPRQQGVEMSGKFLGGPIAERLSKDEQLGLGWTGRPNDGISWLIGAAPPEHRNAQDLALRIFSINVAAVHTTSTAFANALLALAAHPEHIPVLREEAERVVKEHGWTKAALSEMHNIDSFIRESMRFHGGSLLNMARMVVHPNGYRFSNGTHIPYVAFVYVASRATHYDPENYNDPAEFDGFRFSRMREAEQGGGIFKYHLITTGAKYLAWGHGRHACPGRFFAATALKSMLAHVVLGYDVKQDGGQPAADAFGHRTMPSAKAKIFLRARQK
ncbi:cytochrome P450 [Mycena latifolia]|nr:cytochrome P450 [Mycena latifolia]